MVRQVVAIGKPTGPKRSPAGRVRQAVVKPHGRPANRLARAQRRVTKRPDRTHAIQTRKNCKAAGKIRRTPLVKIDRATEMMCAPNDRTFMKMCAVKGRSGPKIIMAMAMAIMIIGKRALRGQA